MKKKPPACIKCEHYYVTYDKHYPRGCRLFEIKSRMAPTFAVLKSTGVHCPAFALKQRKSNQEE